MLRFPARTQSPKTLPAILQQTGLTLTFSEFLYLKKLKKIENSKRELNEKLNGIKFSKKTEKKQKID